MYIQTHTLYVPHIGAYASRCLKIYFIMFYLCVCIGVVCGKVHMTAVLRKSKRGHQILLDLELQAGVSCLTQVLGIQLEFSLRPV